MSLARISQLPLSDSCDILGVVGNVQLRRQGVVQLGDGLEYVVVAVAARLDFGGHADQVRQGAASRLLKRRRIVESVPKFLALLGHWSVAPALKLTSALRLSKFRQLIFFVLDRRRSVNGK